MTVSTVTNTITYTGNAATTSFSFPFAMPAGGAADLTVTTVVSGVTTVIPTTAYSVTLNAPVAPDPTPVGGSVTYPLTGPPLAVGATITIQRVLSPVQASSFSNQGTLYPTTIEEEFDYLTMLLQNVINETIYAIVAPNTDPAGLNYILPSVAARAGNTIIFDSFGNVTVGQPTSAFVSAAMLPVVEAASIAAAQVLLGISQLTEITVTANTLVNSTTSVIFANAASTQFTLTLPAAIGSNQVIRIKKIDTTNNPVSIVVIGGGNIDRTATVVLSDPMDTVSVKDSDSGSPQWWLV